MRYLALLPGPAGWGWLLAAVALGGALAIIGSRLQALRRLGEGPWWWGEAATLALVTALGFAAAWGQVALVNPTLCPGGPDHGEYLAQIVELARPGSGRWSPFRYPLYPYLAVALARAAGVPPYLGGVWVSLYSAALLPAAVYLLARQLAPTPVAAVGALLACGVTPLVATLGQPSTYPLCLLLQILALAAAIWALRGGRWWEHLAAGIALAVFLASTPTALTLAMPALGLMAIGLFLGAKARPRGAALGGLGLALPLAFTWWVFAHGGWELHTLEHSISEVEQFAVHTSAHVEELQQRYPAAPGDISSLGTWRLGDPRALAHLTRTVAFLLDRPDPSLLPRDPMTALQDGLRADLGEAPPALWLLALPACLAVRPRRDPKPQRAGALLAGVLLFVVLAGVAFLPTHAWYVSRYMLPLLVLLPALALAGIAGPLEALTRTGSRAPWLAFLPLLALFAWQSVAEATQVAARQQELLRRPEAQDLGNTPILCALRSDLGPQDRLVRLSGTRVPEALFLGRVPLEGWSTLPDDGVIELPACDAHRRVIVTGCMDHMQNPEARQTWAALAARAAADPRLEVLASCLLEDLAPGEPLTFTTHVEGRQAPPPTGPAR